MKVVRIISLALAILLPLPALPMRFFSSKTPSAPPMELPVPQAQRLPLSELKGYLPSSDLPFKIFGGAITASISLMIGYMAYKKFKQFQAPKVPVLISIFRKTTEDVTKLFELIWLFNNATTHDKLYTHLLKKSDLYIEYNENFMKNNTEGLFFKVEDFPRVKELFAEANDLQSWKNLLTTPREINQLKVNITNLYSKISDVNKLMQGYLLTPNTMDTNLLIDTLSKAIYEYYLLVLTLTRIYNNLPIKQRTLTVPFKNVLGTLGIPALNTPTVLHIIEPIWHEPSAPLRQQANKITAGQSYDTSQLNRQIMETLLPPANVTVLRTK